MTRPSEPLARPVTGHRGSMIILVMLLWILVGVLAWCLLALPLAVVVGRSLAAAGHGARRPGRGGFELAA